MRRIPPGLALIATCSIIAASYLFITSSVLRLLSQYLGITPSVKLDILFATVLCSSYVPAHIIAKFWLQRKEADRLGSKLIPVVKGKWPGNIDVKLSLYRSMQQDYIGAHFRRITERLGNTVKVRFMWTDSILTTEPEHIKRILATDFNNFIKGRQFINSSFSVLGVGVFNSDGDMWKFHRAMTRPFFSRERISDFDLFSLHADDLIAQIRDRSREGYAIDIQDAVARFTLDTATAFFFSQSVRALRSGLPYPYNTPVSIGQRSAELSAAERFGQAFVEAQWAIAKRNSFGALWPIFEITKDATEEPMQVVRAFVEPILADALEKHQHRGTQKKSDEEKLGEEETLLDYLVKHTQDPVILRDEILSMLVAGRDTTASLVTFTTYNLSMYPDILQRLRAEILERVGPTNCPTYDDIREMKYLRAVLNETLRLYPPVPFNIRRTINATTLPDPSGGRPWYVPPETDCIYSVFLMHRRKDLWGPDANEFDPGRFLDERMNRYLTPNPFIFLPFNAGPRICLGQQFAYNEASFMLVRLLQAFDGLELAPDAQPPDSHPPPEWIDAPGRQAKERLFPKKHLTMYMHKGVWLRLNEVENQ